jgi:hypothetical protein
MNQKFEYKFVRHGEGLFGAKTDAAYSYQEVVMKRPATDGVWFRCSHRVPARGTRGFFRAHFRATGFLTARASTLGKIRNVRRNGATASGCPRTASQIHDAARATVGRQGIISSRAAARTGAKLNTL